MDFFIGYFTIVIYYLLLNTGSISSIPHSLGLR